VLNVHESDTMAYCYKTFLTAIKEFLYQARVFVKLGLKT
jgi:hypothetical protein